MPKLNLVYKKDGKTSEKENYNPKTKLHTINSNKIKVEKKKVTAFKKFSCYFATSLFSSSYLLILPLKETADKT